MLVTITGFLLGHESRISQGENAKPYLIADVYQPEAKTRNKTISVMTNDMDCMKVIQNLESYESVTLECSISANKGFLNVYANKVIQ